MKKLLLVAGAAALVALAAATVRLGAAEADDRHATPPGASAGGGAQNLVLGDEGSLPETIEEFLTAVTEDVDRYWTAQFESAGLPSRASPTPGSPRG